MADLKSKNLIKALIMGNPGTGKTCFAASFPGPVLLLDFDNKASSAARFYKEKPEVLAGVEVRILSPSLHKSPLLEFNKIIEDLRQQQSTGVYKYKTLVIDSITTFSAATLSHIITSNPGIKGRVTAQGSMPDKPHYGVLLREFERIIPGLLTLDINVVMLAHIAEYVSEQTGEMIREAMMDGSFSSKLPIYFDEVWRSYVDDKGAYKLQTKSDQKFTKLRSQIPGLPAVVDTKYDGIAKLL